MQQIVQDEEQRRLDDFRQGILDRQSARYRKKLAEALDTDLNKKLVVVNIIWLTCLLTVAFAYCYKSGYTLSSILGAPSSGGKSQQPPTNGAASGDLSTRT